jgi:hypothetical protein
MPGSITTGHDQRDRRSTHRMTMVGGLLSLVAAGGVIWMLIRIISTEGAGLVPRQEIGFWGLIVLHLTVTLLLLTLAVHLLSGAWP